MPQQELEDLYGLPQGNNPYTPEVLDPLKKPQHNTLLARVPPFHILNTVDAYLKECLNLGTTAFILVTGESGTGRTSVTNAIIASYRDQLISSPPERANRFFLPEMPDLNEDPYSIYKKWVFNLRNALYFKRNQLTVPPEFFQDIEKVYQASTPEDYGSRFQQMLGDISLMLAGQKAETGFGMLMEGVKNEKYIVAAKEMFQYARAVCVFNVPSSKQEVISAFGSAFSDQPPNLIRLEGIQGQHVKALLDLRWNGSPPSPFSHLQQGFSQPYPIGKVLSTVSLLLEFRAYENINSPPWPGNSTLGFNDNDLSFGIGIISKRWR